MGNIFELIFIQPLVNILVILYKAFNVVGFPYPLAAAIVGLTLIIRGLLWPVVLGQLKSMRKQHELRPKLARLKELHGDDKARYQQEMVKLYKEHGLNPAAGCLPTLIQLPIFFALWRVLNQFLINGGSSLEKINSLVYHPSLFVDENINSSFLGASLAQRPGDLIWSGHLFYVTIPLVTGLLQIILTKTMLPPKTTSEAKPSEQTIKVNQDKKQSNVSSEALAEQFQTQMVYLMPILIAWFSLNFPLGLTLYWNTFTLVGIIQQYIFFKPAKSWFFQRS